jgi:hypothetical protein
LLCNQEAPELRGPLHYRKEIKVKTTYAITLGIAFTRGTKRVYFHRYPDAVDFGVNLIPRVFGIYIWIETLLA